MKKKTSHHKDEEDQWFVEMMEREGVFDFEDEAPLPESTKREQDEGKRKPSRKRRRGVEIDEDIGPLSKLAYIHSSIHPKIARKLKRGGFRPEDALDLHGLTWKDAKAEIDMWLEEELTHAPCCLLLIHGKAHGSIFGKATLKSMAYHYLKVHPHVRAVVTALPKDGGLGASYLWIT